MAQNPYSNDLVFESMSQEMNRNISNILNDKMPTQKFIVPQLFRKSVVSSKKTILIYAL